MQHTLKAKAIIQIQQSADRVFEVIVDGDIMKNYFIASSTGRLEEGKTVEWNFPEFPEKFPVTAKTITPSSYVSFDWSGGIEGMLVEIFLEAQTDGSTVVRIVEQGAENNDKGIAWVIGQTEGWANFLACLKAWLEHGIRLREGAFDFMK